LEGLEHELKELSHEAEAGSFVEKVELFVVFVWRYHLGFLRSGKVVLLKI
jgi:hypothetical protein